MRYDLAIEVFKMRKQKKERMWKLKKLGRDNARSGCTVWLTERPTSFSKDRVHLLVKHRHLCCIVSLCISDR